MDATKRWLIAILLIRGVAVLSSYVWGIQARPDAGQILWGWQGCQNTETIGYEHNDRYLPRPG
jgi:hypothetical protein